LTIFLWFGFEILGAIIGYLASDGEIVPTYITSLVFAIIGGIVSYLIAKNCAPGDYKTLEGAKLVRTRPLNAPTSLTIQRQSSFLRKFATYSVLLNGVQVGDLKNGERMNIYTNQVENEITAFCFIYFIKRTLKPLYFVVNPGTNALIVFDSTKFKPELCHGIALLSDDDVKLLS
jgi:hypothetical protein